MMREAQRLVGRHHSCMRMPRESSDVVRGNRSAEEDGPKSRTSPAYLFLRCEALEGIEGAGWNSIAAGAEASACKVDRLAAFVVT